MARFNCTLIASFLIEEKDGVKRLILGADGDMVLSKRREESFQFEFVGQVRRQCLKIIAVSLEPAAVNLFSV